jgi:hypothetical protein
MSDKVCLIIDDKLARVESTIENVVLYGEKNGFKIEFIKFDPTDRPFQSEVDGSISKEKLKQYMHDDLLKQKIDLVACDYQFDDPISGLDIVSFIREIRNIPIFMYSGRIDKIVTDLLETNKEEDDNKTIIKSINILINKGILDFIENDMTKLEQALIKHIQKEPSFDYIFENTLSSSHNDLVFKSIYPKFKDMTIRDILLILRKDSVQAEDFKIEIASQLIDFMVKLN